VKRWPPLVLIAALLVGGLILGRDGSSRSDDTVADIDPATLLPVAAPADALDGSWFCAGQSAGDDTPADGTLVVANVGDTTATGTVEVIAAGGDEPVVEPLEVAARTTERIRLADILEADWVAAQVQVEGGTVVVEHEVVGELGRDVAPCQSRASDSWLLPAGASTRDASFTLAIYNPYGGEARLDLSFTTEDSVREPPDLQGLAVGPGALVVVDVSEVVTERAVIATTVSATRGQVVVDRIQTYDGQGAATTDEEAEEETFQREGLTLTPAVPAPQRVWSFPAGVKAGFLHEQVVLFNPNDDTAEVELDIALDDPERNGVLDALPVTVPAGEFTVFDVDAVESIPDAVAHSITVRSESVPVVAERTLAAASEETLPYIGTAASTGSPVAAERWVFATGPEADVDSGRIVVVNPGDAAVEVDVAAFGAGETTPVGEDASGGSSSTFTLEPGARRDVFIDDLDDDARSLSVVADGPIVAERRMVPVESDEETGRGISLSIGVPLRDGLLLLD
jgi:hypothetical protein